MHRLPRIAPVLLLVACDPMAPSARGTITLDDAIDTTGLAWLHLVASADPDGTFQPSDLELGPTDDHADLTSNAVPLSDVTFPYDYEVLNGIGVSSSSSWRLTAWLSADGTTDAPATGEPWATTPFEVDRCMGGGYCGITDGVDLAIDALYE